MSTTVAVPFPPDELAELDDLRRNQRVSREEAICEAVRWYLRWGDRLPVEDPAAEDPDL
jgi:metal-responsive CopG/Arc/MetJ family transcriptional regulator